MPYGFCKARSLPCMAMSSLVSKAITDHLHTVYNKRLSMLALIARDNQTAISRLVNLESRRPWLEKVITMSRNAYMNSACTGRTIGSRRARGYSAIKANRVDLLQSRSLSVDEADANTHWNLKSSQEPRSFYTPMEAQMGTPHRSVPGPSQHPTQRRGD
jgi:hypothetical protein